MKILHFDCISGISGDMTVAALIDLGVKPSTLEWELSKLELGDYHLHLDRETRQGVSGVRFTVHEGATHSHERDHEHDHEHSDHEHGAETHHAHHHQHAEHEEHSHEHQHSHEHEHEHEHPHESPEPESAPADHDHGAELHAHSHEVEHGHPHDPDHDHAQRSYRDIRELLAGSDLSQFVRQHALSIFHRLAIAEGKIHDITPEDVCFHEVGALDSIIDIVAVCVGLEELGVESVHMSPLEEGRGWVKCAHGRLPLPAPATLELLRGISLGQADVPFELITPTGAAIAAEFGVGFGLMPRMQVDRVGYGVGSRDVPGRPNVLRAVLGEAQEAASPDEADTITQIECNIDDLNPEILGAVMDQLFEAGALDVWLTPIYMKKQRSATLLTALVKTEDQTSITDLLFKETSTFGVRFSDLKREKLTRKADFVETPWGSVEVKIGSRSGAVMQVSPEFESVRKVAKASGQPIKSVFEAAIAAIRAKGA